MEEKRNALAKKWLKKSERDLLAARILADYSPPIFDYAIFHCQQAAEKAIKAFLVYHGEEFPTGSTGHKLYALINLAIKFDKNINSQIDFRNELTKFAVETRYPDYGFGDADKFSYAWHNARSFCEYVHSVLPPEVPPPKQSV